MKSLITFILTIIGFLIISALPALIFSAEELGFFVLPFFQTIYHNLMNLFQPEQWVYLGTQKSYPLFPMLWDRYFYSMTIFTISLFIALILSHFFMIIIQVAPKKMKKTLLSISTLIESLPDAFIIISLQLLVILIYKKTNILVAQIAVFEEDIYLLPIICLSIIPTFLLFKANLFLLKEEESKLYIDLAKMKGLTSLRILLVHTFRNVLYSLFYRSKIIFSFMLSNLFLIEIVFNMNGALQFLLRARGPEFIVVAVLLFTPFFLFFATTERAMLKITGESRELL